MIKICILTPDASFDARWRPIADRYIALLGPESKLRTWNDSGDLSGFDLIVPLMAWGYQRDPARWFQALDAWEAAGLRFANPIATLRWNSNKDYLFDLADAGVAIVPTRMTNMLVGDDIAAARAEFGCDALVIKPPISGGADATYRLGPEDPIPFDVLERPMLIQPMIPMIASEGEFSLIYFAGRFSHAVLKIPQAGDFRVQEQFGGRELGVDVAAEALALADAALAAAPGELSYARVDMVRGNAGDLLLMELELIEPWLFLDHARDGGAAFVAAMAGTVS